MEPENDNGLGLAAFVSGSKEPEGAAAPSQEAEKVQVTYAPEKTEKDAKPVATTETKPKEGKETKPSPSDSDSGIKTEVEKALAGGKKKAEAAKTAVKPEDGTKTAAPADRQDEPGKEEQAQKPTWDSDDNPYRKQASDAEQRLAETNQRLQQTRNFASEVNNANRTLRRQMERLEKKIDGTYDPEEEKRLDAEEQRTAASQAPTPEEAAHDAELRGATRASLHMAYETHGKEKVDAEIREFDQLFQRNPLMMHRVTSSRQPIQESMKILNEFRMAKKYGTADMTELIAKVKEEAIAEATPGLVEKITKEIMDKLSLKDKETQGIRSIRGGGRDAVAEHLSGDNADPKPLSVLFPN